MADLSAVVVRAAALVPYRLPLTAPFRWSGGEVAAREGVLLRLEGEGGLVGWGDAAPLPGFSRETLAEVRAALEPAARALVDRALDPRAIVAAGGPLQAALDAAGLPPSARFALELALADLAAQTLGTTIPHLLHPDPAVSLPVNALLGEDAAADAARRVAEGYRTLKLKVGARAVADDLARARAVREAAGPAVALRADANRAWTWDEAVRFAEGAREIALDYVEEPLREPARLPALWLDTGLPLALDESVAEGAEVRGWARAVVLKPTLLGGLAATLRRAAEARAVGVRAVLSGAFESGVGLRGVAALAAATGAEPAGLDPYRRLAADVLAARLPLDRPTLDVPGLFARPLEVTAG